MRRRFRRGLAFFFCVSFLLNGVAELFCAPLSGDSSGGARGAPGANRAAAGAAGADAMRNFVLPASFSPPSGEIIGKSLPGSAAGIRSRGESEASIAKSLELPSSVVADPRQIAAPSGEDAAALALSLPSAPRGAAGAGRGSRLPSARGDLREASSDPGAAEAVFGGGAGGQRPSDAEGALAREWGIDEGVNLSWVRSQRKRTDTPAQRVIDGVVRREGFRAVALNQDVIVGHNAWYTHRVPMGSRTDQADSGRCWIFAGLNTIRSILIARGPIYKKIGFSANHTNFYALLEKSNRHLEHLITAIVRRSLGKNIPEWRLRAIAARKLEEGGYSDDFLFLVGKYGLVPDWVMPETAGSRSSYRVLAELDRTLAEAGAEILKRTDGRGPAEIARLIPRIKDAAMRRVWRILTVHLGVPVESFEHRTVDKRVTPKKSPVRADAVFVDRYTPRQFARDYVGFHPEDYVTVTTYPRKNIGEVYEVKRTAIGVPLMGQRRYNQRFLNTRPERLEELVIASIDRGQAVWFGADIDKDVDHASGIMHPEIFRRDSIYGFTAAERGSGLTRDQATYLGIEGPNHGMLITGYDRPKADRAVVKYRVENSWGEDAGDEGVYHMYRRWMHENVYEILVHKSLLNAAELKAWEGEPTRIRPRDAF